MNKMFFKIFSLRIIKRIYIERLGEPLIYNIISIFFFFFGNINKKIEYDLVPRQPYAFGLNEAFKRAKLIGQKKITIVEFGVASGAGLFNLAYIAERLEKYYKIDYQIFGFDTGDGLPKPIDYRDHPEKYRTGDYPPEKLTSKLLPPKTSIIYGKINETLIKFKNEINEDAKIAFVSIDVDYYSSTKDCLTLFLGKSNQFLPSTVLYLDDVFNIDHNPFMGELLAINEFNLENENRKICKMTQLKNWRIFKNALFIDQMYFLHVLDSEYRNPDNWEGLKTEVLTNPYI